MKKLPKKPKVVTAFLPAVATGYKLTKLLGYFML